MTAHTPGPWRVDATRQTAVRGFDGRHVATLEAGSQPTRDADARLIAAAPDLLAALRRVAPWIGKLIADGGHLQCVAPQDAVGALDQAEAAIAKAKGE